MAHKICLAFLWHQHQPYYEDLKTGRAVMPWVRLHATKDYYDMVALMDDFPKIRMTVNLVPSLLLQLQNFADGKCTDDWADKTLANAETLTEKDKAWILENFFFCNWDTMIFPHPRYAELFEKRGRFATRQDVERVKSYFSAQDFLDLQVWFNLAWMDPLWRETDPLIGHLYKKQKRFSEGEKEMLVQKQRDICRLTIEKHKELWAQGRIEVSTTPFYHPILPLLCDTDSAQMAMPGSLKPRHRFQHPEDAKRQVERALEYVEQTLGKRPVGMWPSEGSVSEDVVKILTDAGLKWAATDEAVLFNSLHMARGGNAPRESLFEPYRVKPEKGGDLQMVFRDHGLSDAVGFVYSRTDARHAVNDFVHRVTRIADHLPEDHGRPPLVSVILDGENCWEYYPNDGRDFLKTLYQTLSDHPRIETVTVGGYLERYPARQTLPKLWSGSWIGSNFAIWIGHPEDNRAWDLVKEARDFLMDHLQKHPEKAGTPEAQKSLESLYIAEGSDWCWWYGDQNSTAHDAMFDELFRGHVKNIYSFMGHEPPDKLNIAIKGKEQKGHLVHPVQLITPKVDGLVSSYYEWKAAGQYQTGPSGGAMHQAESTLSDLYYGFNLEKLFMRFDLASPRKDMDLSDLKLKISFMEPANHELQISWELVDAAGPKPVFQPKALFLNAQGEALRVTEVAMQKILELALPWNHLGLKPGDPFEFVVLVLKSGLQIESWPHQSSVKSKRPTPEFNLEFWSV